MNNLLTIFKQIVAGTPDNVQTSTFEFKGLGYGLLVVLGIVLVIAFIIAMIYITNKIINRPDDDKKD